MVIKNRLFPYPVLSEDTDDYREGSFTVEPVPLDKEETEEEFAIGFNIDLQESKLKQLIYEDKAEYVIHIECTHTSYRDKIVTKNDTPPAYKFKKKEVNEYIQLLAMVVATEDIHFFSDTALNRDYDDVNDVYFPKGAILAYYNMPRLNINKQYEELTSSDNIFTLVNKPRNSEKEHNPISFSIDSQKIKIFVDDDIYKSYLVMRLEEKNKPLIMISFVYPALIYMIEELRSRGEEAIEDCQNTIWYLQISKYYEKDGRSFINDIVYSDESVTKLAQEMLNNPISELCQFFSE